jgi:hypothetical protein
LPPWACIPATVRCGARHDVGLQGHGPWRQGTVLRYRPSCFTAAPTRPFACQRRQHQRWRLPSRWGRAMALVANQARPTRARAKQSAWRTATVTQGARVCRAVAGGVRPARLVWRRRDELTPTDGSSASKPCSTSFAAPQSLTQPLTKWRALA